MVQNALKASENNICVGAAGIAMFRMLHIRLCKGCKVPRLAAPALPATLIFGDEPARKARVNAV